jgi:hypothetical protein
MMAMLHLQDAQLLQHNFDALSRKLAERKASLKAGFMRFLHDEVHLRNLRVQFDERRTPQTEIEAIAMQHGILHRIDG